MAHSQAHLLLLMLLNALSHRKQAKNYFIRLYFSDSFHISVKIPLEQEIKDQYRLFIIICVLEGVFNELRYDLTQNRACCLKARISINLYQPNIIIFVYHKVQPKNLKIINSSQRIDIQCRGMNCICCNLFHFRVDLFEKIEIRIILLHIRIKFLIRYLISFLIPTIIR